jgi:hypothetical protein
VKFEVVLVVDSELRGLVLRGQQAVIVDLLPFVNELGYPRVNCVGKRRYVHEIFHRSVWVVESCSHRSFDFGPFESHGH